MHHRPPKIGTLTKSFIFLSTFAILCNYYYLYFVQFSEGSADAGATYSALKILGILLACTSLLTTKVKTSYKAEELLLLLFLITSSIIFLLKSTIMGISDVMFISTIICITPFIALEPKQDPAIINTFLECCLFIMTTQVAVDSLIYLCDKSIWTNRAFIGGLGNPSSFGLVCNILISYLLFYRALKISTAIYLPTLAAGVYMTSSMLSLIVLLFIIVIWTTRRISIKKLVASCIIIIATAFLSTHLVSDHLIYKLNSAINVFSEEEADDSSRSVSLRMQIHNDYATNFENHPIEALAYGFTEASYMKFDSQIITYLSSFGLLCSLLFLIFFIIQLIQTLRQNMTFQTVCLLIFGMTFVTNRILDYYPIPLFFALIVIMSRAPKFSSKQNFRD